MTTATTSKPRPSVGAAPPVEDGRVTRSRAAILRAAADLLIEGGAARVTIERVAERSGVAKTTIYRHWDSRSRLIFDAFASLLPGYSHEPGAGALRDQLVGMLFGLVRGLTESEWAPAVSALIDAADRDPEVRALVHDFLVERMAPLRAILGRARAAGELPLRVDIDVAVSMVAGAVFYRRLVSREQLDRAFVEGVVAQFLHTGGGSS